MKSTYQRRAHTHTHTRFRCPNNWISLRSSRATVKRSFYPDSLARFAARIRFGLCARNAAGERGGLGAGERRGPCTVARRVSALHTHTHTRARIRKRKERMAENRCVQKEGTMSPQRTRKSSIRNGKSRNGSSQLLTYKHLKFFVSLYTAYIIITSSYRGGREKKKKKETTYETRIRVLYTRK